MDSVYYFKIVVQNTYSKVHRMRLNIELPRLIETHLHTVRMFNVTLELNFLRWNTVCKPAFLNGESEHSRKYMMKYHHGYSLCSLIPQS